MKNKLIIIILMVSTLCYASKDSKSNTKASIPDNFMLKILDPALVREYSQSYIIKNKKLTVLSWSHSHTPLKMYSKVLSSKTLKKLIVFLKELKLENLDSFYERPEVKDGTQLNFHVIIGKFNKKITIRNRNIPELLKICKEINKLIPKNIQVRLPERISRYPEDIVAKEDNIIIFNYSDFGPQSRAYKLIGMEWWSWGNHGDSRFKVYDIRVVVYKDISLDKVKKLYPTIKKKKQDYRYLKYADAIKYLNKHIGEKYSYHLIETRNKITEKLGE